MALRPDTLQVSPVADADKDMVARMLQLYLHDFSEFASLHEPYGELEPDGTFWYPDIATYWSAPDHTAFLVRVGDRVAGFALVNQWSASGLGTDNAIAEFFTLRKYRRKGVGTLAARTLIDQRSGMWEIPVAIYNRPALQFWRAVVSTMRDYTVEETTGDGQRWSGPIWRVTKTT